MADNHEVLASRTLTSRIYRDSFLFANERNHELQPLKFDTRFSVLRSAGLSSILLPGGNWNGHGT